MGDAGEGKNITHNQKKLDEKSIHGLLEQEWQSGAFEYKVREEKFKEQGIEMLSNYVKNIKTDIPNVIATELNFNFQLNEVTIVGSIDRLDKEISFDFSKRLILARRRWCQLLGGEGPEGFKSTPPPASNLRGLHAVT